MNIALIVLIVAVVVLVVSGLVLFLLLRKGHVPPEGALATDPKRNTDEVGLSFQRAFAAVRAKTGGTALEQRLPYILLIGDPDSGKTTLLNAVDNGASSGATAVGSVSWRFLNKGAVIDIPGNFLVAPDGKTQSDGRWERVLKSLVRHRAHMPANGIVLTVAATDLLADDDPEQAKLKQRAISIRQKLDELQRELGLVLPIHLLVTKCDEVNGFGSFCWEIDRERKDDMFGWSNPNTLETAFSPEWIDEAFDAIQDDIGRQQLQTFGSRPASPEMEGSFVFPLELESLRSPLRVFATEVFRETAYVDANFFRGVFLCGDCTIVRQLPGAPASITEEPGRDVWRRAKRPTEISGKASLWERFVRPRTLTVVPNPRRDLAFAREFFEHRVLSETQIARPVTRIRLARRRKVLIAQLTLASFVLFFGIGTEQAWSRLSDLRDHKFVALLNALIQNTTAAANGKAGAPSLQTAYNLVDTLATLNASGFKSFFMPGSWGDPLDHRLADALSAAFERTVFPAFSTGLDRRARELMGNCEAAVKDASPDSAPALDFSNVEFTKNSDYAALAQFVRKYGELEAGLDHYESVRHPGLGSFKNIDALFQYLLGKGVSDSEAVSNSHYYQHAISNSTAAPVPFTNNGQLSTCARQLTGGLVKNFYSSWFANNPLLTNATEVANEISDLEDRKLQNNDDLANLAENIRELDSEVSSGSTAWLTNTNFDPSSYPALAGLSSFDFINADVREQINTNGGKGLTTLKQQLFSTGSELSGAVLEQHGTDVRVSGNVVALEAGLAALLHQEFMGQFASRAVDGETVIWNKSALMSAMQLPPLYDKYLREQLPLLPPSFRGVLQQVAARNVNAAAAAQVANAQEPQGVLDETTALMAIRSFNDAVPMISQLQAALPGGLVSASTGFHLVLNKQAVALAKWLDGELRRQPPYPYSVTVDSSGEHAPLSYQLLKVDSQDGIEEYLANQREHIRSLATDYASPLASYLQVQGLQHAADFDQWSAIVHDVSDYDSKKPGNSIAALENFVRTDINKIAVENGCHTSGSAERSSDYFLMIRSTLQSAAVEECSSIALSAYQNQLARFFNSKLAGRFPFAPLSSEPGAAQADPADVSEFLRRIGEQAGGLKQFFSGKDQYAEELKFIDQCLALRDMLAATAAGEAPAADLTVYFRVNQAAEKGGNQIIDWSLEAGDVAIHYPGSDNSLRWHYGDGVHVEFRYAKDSPQVPKAAASDANVRIDGRTVAWSYSGPWALFELFAQHGGKAANFGVSPQMLPSTLGFVIPATSDTSHEKVTATAVDEGNDRVFLRIVSRVSDGKQAHEVPMITLPTRAPVAGAISAKA